MKAMRLVPSVSASKWMMALPLLLLGLWFGGMGWGIDAALRRFERHTTATPPHVNPNDSWRQARCFIDPDAYLWLSYTRDLRQSGHWRLRHTTADNAPYGREMHWCHLPIWSLMALSAGLEKTGLSPPLALEIAGRLLMPLAGFLLFSALYLYLRRRIGIGAAALCALAPAALLFWDFHPLRPDHHAFQIMAAFSCALFLLFSGFGWTEKGKDRPPLRLFIASGICGGFGLWFGATVFYFTLAALTISAAGVLLISPQPSHPAKSQMHPGVWRIWAWAGAGTALLLYALEYAPGPFPPRLEVNHPLYALSWLGIGECLFLLARWKHQDRRLSAPRLLHAALALLAAAALPALVLWGPESSYLPRTTLMWRLHARHIHEFLTVRAFAIQNQESAVGLLLRFLGPGLACIVGWVGLSPKLRLPFAARLTLAFATPIFLLFTALLLWQVRWRSFAAMASLLLVVAALWALRTKSAPLARRPAQALVLMLGLQWLVGIAIGLHPLFLMAKVSKIDPLYFKALQLRNWMVNLKEISNSTPVRLLAPAEMGPAAYYFGAGDAIGTLYWENLDGLAAAAECFADPLPGARAREVIAERGITHVAMNEGAQDALMFHYLHTGRDDQAGAAQTVGGALTGIGTSIPEWLRYDEPLNQTVNPPLYTFVPAIGQWALTRLPTRLYVVDAPPPPSESP